MLIDCHLVVSFYHIWNMSSTGFVCFWRTCSLLFEIPGEPLVHCHKKNRLAYALPQDLTFMQAQPLPGEPTSKRIFASVMVPILSQRPCQAKLTLTFSSVFSLWHLHNSPFLAVTGGPNFPIIRRWQVSVFNLLAHESRRTNQKEGLKVSHEATISRQLCKRH